MIRYSPFPVLAAVAFFVVLAVWTMAPVLADLDGAIPGAHLGDNATGLWNVWWFARALEEGQPLYRTNDLFAPFGTQLSLHTHATTHSVMAWPLTSLTSLVAGHDLAILAGLALNGICTALLAYRLTRRMLPAMVAGALFAFSGHIQLRVLGHINLVHAWVLPLFALALLRLEARKRLRDALLVGVAGAVVIYTDYYYAVFAALFAVVWAAARALAIRVSNRSPRLRGLRTVLLALVIVDLALIAAIAWSGGTALELGPIRISARGMRNPLTAMWILLIAWAALRFPVSVSVRLQERWYRDAPRAGLTSLSFVILTGAPLLFALAQVVAGGDYTAPRVLWRSSPAGGDALTLVLGHPRHLLAGPWTRSAYDALDIDMMEQSLWLGLVPLAVIAATRRNWREAPDARLWMAVALFFFVLSLGPFLRVGGFDTSLPLPHAVLRYVPGIGNARIPGRAIVMVNLAIAMLTAIALSDRRLRSSRASLGLAALMVLEVLPAPASAERIPRPDAIDQFLSSSTEPGAVAELPTGLRDGFGEAGALDHRALVHQLWHERPIVGGFVARLSSSVRAGYEASPILTNLIDLSTPAAEDARLMPDAAGRARELGIAYVILNRDTFIANRLPQYGLESAGFRFLQKSGPRELYATSRPTPQAPAP